MNPAQAWKEVAKTGRLEELADKILTRKETPDTLVERLKKTPVHRERDIDRVTIANIGWLT